MATFKPHEARLMFYDASPIIGKRLMILFKFQSYREKNHVVQSSSQAPRKDSAIVAPVCIALQCLHCLINLA